MGVTFTEAGAAKIKQAVKKVLNAPQDRTAARNQPHPTETFFWGLITGADATGLRFHFLRVIPDASKDSEADFMLTSGPAYRFAGAEPESGLAREANGNRPVPGGIVVLMNFIGYDKDGEPAYLFQYGTERDRSYLSPHDHRDNSQNSGGYAFAVYSPGTSIPQQNWGL